MTDLIKGFRDFISRGSIIELAIAFVIALAFFDVVSSFVSNLLLPVVGVILSEPFFFSLDFTINDSVFSYGAFIDSLVTFTALAAAIYFIVVLPLNKIAERSKRGETPEDSPVKSCPECLSSIPRDARRCMYCTSPQST